MSYLDWRHRRAVAHGWTGQNLNLMRIDDESPSGQLLRDPGVNTGETMVVFRNLVHHLATFINEADAVVGCCAWLTHARVLRALERKRSVSIVINKEDFLRPDAQGSTDRELREHYTGLPGINRYEHEPVAGLSFASDPDSDAVRCLGVCDGRPPSFRPRLHHKFLVALRFVPDPIPDSDCAPMYLPEAVWTGSFNPTRGGERSLENAIVMTDCRIAASYYAEWGQAFALSEPLDWDAPYVAPEYWIGS